MPSERRRGERRRAGTVRCDHEAGLRRAQQMARLAHIISGAAGEFLAWSESLPALIGADGAALPTSTRAWLRLVHREDRERFRRTAADAAVTGKRAELEYRLQRASGEWIHIRAVMEPLDSEQPTRTAQRWLNTLQDVTAAKQAARVLQAAEQSYRETLEQAAVGVAHSSLQGDLQSVNKAFCRMTGYSPAEALAFNIRELTHPQDLRPSVTGRARMISGGTPYQRELRLLRRDGSYVWANVTTLLMRRPNGSPTHFVSVVTDISERKRAEDEVKRFQAAMDATVDSIFLTEPNAMRFLYVNETACRRLGYPREQILHKPPYELLGKTREELKREDDEVLAAGERGMRTETRYFRSDGSSGWTELYRRALLTEGGMVIVTVARDITERKAQGERIERLSRVHAVLSRISAAIVRIRDREGLLRESCRIAHETGGFDAVSIWLTDPKKGLAEPVAWHGRKSSERLRPGRFSLQNGGQGSHSLLMELMQTRRPVIANDAPGDPRIPSKEAMAAARIHSVALLPLVAGDNVLGLMAIYSSIANHFDDDEVRLLSELAADISYALEHLEKSERATYLALFDELTGLANRRLLAERLGQFAHAAGRAQRKLALALLDIERLRAVNKSLGRGAGDALLRQVAERLAKAASAGTVGRIASNEFAVVLPEFTDKSEAERMIAALKHACFGSPYVVEDHELKVGVKIGVAIFPHDGLDAETVLVNAEAALRKAKAGGERQLFYTADLTERTGVWLPMEVKLAGALDRNEFVLHYQPKIETASGTIVGVEALIRWHSPDFGLVSPGRFIPLMEETGMILEVGAWALRRAALDHRRWTELGLKAPRVSVNVSPVQLRHREFVQAVQQALRDGVSPFGIDLEVTESVVMDDVEENIRKLKELRELGLQIAIDDFGTGYSSLSYLARLPVQALKIDRSFIMSMLMDPAAMTLVQTIISLAHTLGLVVIAEGVEEKEQADSLRLLRCNQMQGYLIGKPSPFDETTGLLRANGERQDGHPRSRPDPQGGH